MVSKLIYLKIFFIATMWQNMSGGEKIVSPCISDKRLLSLPHYIM